MATVGDLRTLVARRVGLKRRVAMLGSDAALVNSLQQNGCELLVDPGSLEEIAGFSPEVVVAFDGFVLDDGRAAFAMLAKAVPAAEVVFSFAHAGSATATVTALTGASPVKAFAERDVNDWLGAAGYAVTSRDVVVVPHVASGLSADTESALRQLFEQLNPDAAADRLLVVAKRGSAVTRPERTKGLISVVISAGADGPALEGTLASLVGQQQRPMELVLSSALSLEKTDALLSKARARAGITPVAVSCTSNDWAARTNAGLAQAQGQYLACVEAGDLLTPFHLAALVKRLADGTRAWALSASATGLPSAFSLATWLQSGAVARQSYVIDRDRTAAFPLTFAEGVAGAEAMRFARLAALFEPEWLCGAPSIEGVQPAVGGLETLLEAMRTRPLRMVTALSEVLKVPAAPRLRDVLSARVKGLTRSR